MSAPTLPRVAAELDLCSGVFYAAESTLAGQPDEHLIVWLPAPRFPAGAEELYRWAEDDSHIETRHVTLTKYSMAEALFISGVEPLELNDADALDAIGRGLAEVHCDMLRCSARVSGELGQHSEFAAPLWHRCVQRVARLMEVEA